MWAGTSTRAETSVPKLRLMFFWDLALMSLAGFVYPEDCVLAAPSADRTTALQSRVPTQDGVVQVGLLLL